MSDWIVVPAPLPAGPGALDGPDGWAMHGLAAVSRAVDVEHWGYDDIAHTAAESLAHLRNQQATTRVLLVAGPRAALGPDEDGRAGDDPAGGTGPRADDVLGTAQVSMPRRANERTAYLEVLVRPEHRRRGLGTALLRASERLAAEHGRTVLMASTEHSAEPVEQDPTALRPPTGNGRIAATDPETTFALHHGYRLAQAERYSVLQLPVDPGLLGRLHRDAADKAGTAYRLHGWRERTPDAWAEQFAALCTRMSTDVPLGDLEMAEDPWDVARLRAAEDESTSAGHGSLTVVAEHVPTGTLAAFTTVRYPLDAPEVVFQEDTLVLREHRGRRLGMLVKAELLARLRDHRPQAARIHTWNAEENDHMLGINVALGFRPRGVIGMWQKKTGAQPTGG